MIRLTEPNQVINQKLPDGSKGYMLRFDLDISLDSDFVIDLAYFSAIGQQIPFVCRSVVLNNTNNANVLNMTFDRFLAYPHICASGQISVAQVPNIAGKTYLELTTTLQGASTLVYIFLSDFSMNPAQFGSFGQNVVVTNTIAANISNVPTVDIGALPDVTVGANGPSNGVQANAWNAAIVAANGTSASLDTGGSPVVTAFGSISAATTIRVQYSQDNATWYNGPNSEVLSAAGTFALDFTTAARYVRLISTAAATITATLCAKV